MATTEEKAKQEAEEKAKAKKAEEEKAKKYAEERAEQKAAREKYALKITGKQQAENIAFKLALGTQEELKKASFQELEKKINEAISVKGIAPVVPGHTVDYDIANLMRKVNEIVNAINAKK